MESLCHLVSTTQSYTEDCDNDPLSDDLIKSRSRLREDYLKSMFMCASPEALAPLAAKMYQRFVELCPEYKVEVEKYSDNKKKVHE